MGFPAFPTVWVGVTWIFDPTIAARPAGVVAVNRHEDGLVHGRGGVPAHTGDGVDPSLVRRHRSADIRIPYDEVHGMKSVVKALSLGVAILALTACVGMPSDGAPTAAPALSPPSWSIRETASVSYRLDLGSGVVVAFVEGLTPEMSEKVAYVTHVPSGSQAILDADGAIVHRQDGQADGPSGLDAVLNDGDAMARILEGLTNGEDARPKGHAITWVPMVTFNDIHYVRRWYLVGRFTRADIDDLTLEHLGPELYRVAFRGDGYVGSGYRYQDGDATFLNPGTPIYEVKGYSPKFRLATLEQGRPTLYEADTNPLARTGEDLLDIRGKVTAIDILNDDNEMSILGTMDDKKAVERFVDMVLEAPVSHSSRDRDGPRYFLGIRLADGTSVIRAFWLETGELSRGIMTDPEAATIVSDALQTNPGPDDLLTAEQAKAEGLAQARIAGLVGEPTSVFAELTTLEQYLFTSSNETGECCPPVSPLIGAPDQEVWVVAFRGACEVDLARFGRGDVRQHHFRA